MNKFFQLGGKYNPQFVFQEDINMFPKQLLKPHTSYFQVAQRILDTINADYESDIGLFQRESGELITKEETERQFDEYIEKEGLNDMIRYEFSENFVSPTTFLSGKSKCKVSVSFKRL